MAFDGDLDSVSLPLIFRRIAAGRQTGILTIQGDDDIVAVSFLKGQVVSADALQETVEDGLGQVLAEERLLPTAELQQVAEEHQRGGGGTLAELLVNKGLLTRQQLLSALRQQTYRLLYRILGWQRGEFKFYGGDEVSYEEGFDPISVAELLVRGAEKHQDAALPSLRKVFSRRQSDRPVMVFERDGDGSEAGLWLTRQEMELLNLSDGKLPAADLAEQIGLNRYEALYALSQLIDFGLLVPAEAGFFDTVEDLEPMPAEAGEGVSPQLAETGTLEDLSFLRPETPVLEEEIFVPPDDLDLGDDGPSTRVLEERRLQLVGVWQEWLAAALATALAMAVILTAVLRPSFLSFPLPWQEPERESYEDNLRVSHHRRLDSAALAYFLANGRFPQTLDQLVELGVLGPGELRDRGGETWTYIPSEDGSQYRLAPTDGSAGGNSERRVVNHLYLDEGLITVPESNVPALYPLD